MGAASYRCAFRFLLPSSTFTAWLSLFGFVLFFLSFVCSCCCYLVLTLLSTGTLRIYFELYKFLIVVKLRCFHFVLAIVNGKWFWTLSEKKKKKERRETLSSTISTIFLLFFVVSCITCRTSWPLYCTFAVVNKIYNLFAGVSSIK